MVDWVSLGFFVAFMMLGYGFGRYYEKRHYRSIIRRERELLNVPILTSRELPPLRGYSNQLVSGSVVVSIDYFKRVLAGLRNLFGGRVTPYESLLDRARREARLRMAEQAREMGARMIFNVKLETSSLYKGRRKSIGSVEVLAYGTAMIPGR